METINKLVEDARELVNIDRKKNIEKIFLEIEKFLSEHDIPVNSDYTDSSYWQYNAYPIIQFRNTSYDIKEKLLPKFEKLFIHFYIDNYIYKLNYNNYPIVNFFNVFWPYQNTKYTFATYKDKARVNKHLEMTYVHPKYLLEDLYYKLSLPNWHDDKDLKSKKKQLMTQWKLLDTKLNFEQKIETPNQLFSKMQMMLINKINKRLLTCDYDPTVPIFIGSDDDIEFCKIEAKKLFPNVEIVENSSKSFFDPRVINFVFKVDNYILAKIWRLLDHEIIPKLPFDKKIAHIMVLIRLCLTEHITYEILGINQISDEKFKLFLYLLQKKKN